MRSKNSRIWIARPADLTTLKGISNSGATGPSMGIRISATDAISIRLLPEVSIGFWSNQARGSEKTYPLECQQHTDENVCCKDASLIFSGRRTRRDSDQ